MTHFTNEIKKKISHDWNDLYPEMGIYKDLWLMKRIGPILIGIYLDRPTGNNRYRLITHIHNLCLPSPVILLTLRQVASGLRGGEYVIPVMAHEERFREGSMKLERETFLKLRQEMSFSEIINAYHSYTKWEEARGHVTRFSAHRVEEILLLYTWAGKPYTEVNYLLDKYRQEMAMWPARILSQLGEFGLPGWYERVSSAIKDRGNILRTVEEEIIRHKLKKIPYREMIID